MHMLGYYLVIAIISNLTLTIPVLSPEHFLLFFHIKLSFVTLSFMQGLGPTFSWPWRTLPLLNFMKILSKSRQQRWVIGLALQMSQLGHLHLTSKCLRFNIKLLLLICFLLVQMLGGTGCLPPTRGRSELSSGLPASDPSLVQGLHRHWGSQPVEESDYLFSFFLSLSALQISKQKLNQGSSHYAKKRPWSSTFLHSPESVFLPMVYGTCRFPFWLFLYYFQPSSVCEAGFPIAVQITKVTKRLKLSL